MDWFKVLGRISFAAIAVFVLGAVIAVVSHSFAVAMVALFLAILVMASAFLFL